MTALRSAKFCLLLLAGVVIRSQAQVPTLSLARPAWTATEQFTNVTAIRELKSGAVLVTDFAEPAIYLVAAGGKTTRQLGRKGSGPNEYLTPLRLIPLPGDSTLMLDRDPHRFLTIDPEGRLVATNPFPAQLEEGGEFVRGADQQGRLYFQVGFAPRVPTGPPTLAVYRWDRKARQPDSIATVLVPNPKPIERNIPGVGTAIVRRLMPFTPQDDWAVAPSGRVAIARAEPYRVDWREATGMITTGESVKYAAVPVVEADKKRREPKGPPYQLEYPSTKPPFAEGYLVIDDRERVWVRRERAANATDVSWDVFDARGKHVGDLVFPANKRIMAITSHFAYVIRTDDDGVQWLEAYAR